MNDIAEAQAGRIRELEDEAALLRWFLRSLRAGGCWCPAGLGHPHMQHHADNCKAIASYFKDGKQGGKAMDSTSAATMSTQNEHGAP